MKETVMDNPLMVEASTRKRRAIRRNFRAENDYDKSPPRCGTCTYLLQRAKGNTETAAHGPFCNKGKFPTVLVAVCDAWESQKGERLDRSS